MSLSVLLFRLLYVGTRLPRTPWWAEEAISHVMVILVIGIMAVGVGLVVNAISDWRQHLYAVLEITGTAGVLAVDWLVWMVTGRMLSSSRGTPAPAPKVVDGPDVPAASGASRPFSKAVPGSGRKVA
ncbi:MAG: hypothetical protein WB783_13805 [Arenicellales bacterium]